MQKNVHKEGATNFFFSCAKPRSQKISEDERIHFSKILYSTNVVRDEYMEHPLEKKFSQEWERAMVFLKQGALRSEAYVRGREWVRAQIADLKIDLWLATEQGEDTQNDQVEWMHRHIDLLTSTLHRTVFDPDPETDGFLSFQSAAADLAQYALCIAQKDSQGTEMDFRVLCGNARRFLESSEAQTIGHNCMERVLHRSNVLFEDVMEVIQRAKHLLSCLES